MQMNELRSMTAEEPQEYRSRTAGPADVCSGPAMINNYRPLQPRGDRPVFRSFDYSTTSGCREADDENDDDEDNNGKKNGDDDK